MTLKFGPDLGATEWDGLAVSHHCTLFTAAGKPVGVLFRMEHPAIPQEAIDAFHSYRLELMDATCCASTDRQALLNHLDTALAPTAPAQASAHQ